MRLTLAAGDSCIDTLCHFARNYHIPDALRHICTSLTDSFRKPVTLLQPFVSFRQVLLPCPNNKGRMAPVADPAADPFGAVVLHQAEGLGPEDRRILEDLDAWLMDVECYRPRVGKASVALDHAGVGTRNDASGRPPRLAARAWWEIHWSSEREVGSRRRALGDQEAAAAGSAKGQTMALARDVMVLAWAAGNDCRSEGDGQVGGQRWERSRRAAGVGPVRWQWMKEGDGGGGGGCSEEGG